MSQRALQGWVECSFLLGSHVFTAVWMISVIPRYPEPSLNRSLSSLLFQLMAILGQDPVYRIPNFFLKSAFPVPHKSLNGSSWCCSRGLFYQGVWEWMQARGGWIEMFASVCVGWLKAGRGVSSQMPGLQLAGWVGGELHWKAAVPAKRGLSRHWEEIIHISSASSSSSQPPAEQHNADPEHE